MKCFRCAAAVPEGANFCGRCGTQVLDPDGSTMVLAPEDGESLLRLARKVFAGEYEIEEELGRGGMGIVFRAKELALHRTVALKILPPDLGVTVKAAERFKREARLVAELDHANITPVYRAGQVGGILHISMKYVEGRSLERIIEEQGALPVVVVIAVLRAAARALAYAHEHDIVHRDVKGGNILVDHDGRVLVSDFGAALRASDVTLTAPGSLIGTPAFMSPEQCAGRRALPQSDQYSLGVVAFQMLTGSVPFRSETLVGLMQHHFLTPPPDLLYVRPDLPARLVEVVQQMLAKDPAHRFATTRELLAAMAAVPMGDVEQRESERLLRDLARGAGVERVATQEIPAPPELRTLLVAPERPQLPAPVSRRRKLLRAAAAVAAMGLVGTAAIWAAGREVAPPVLAGGDTAAAQPAPPPPSPPPPAPLAPASAMLLPSSSSTEPPAARRVVPRAPGKLRLSTSPPDAEILVDGRLAGVGSVWDWSVAEGRRRVRIRAAGYRAFDTTLVVASGATVSLGRVALTATDPE